VKGPPRKRVGGPHGKEGHSGAPRLPHLDAQPLKQIGEATSSETAQTQGAKERLGSPGVKPIEKKFFTPPSTKDSQAIQGSREGRREGKRPDGASCVLGEGEVHLSTS